MQNEYQNTQEKQNKKLFKQSGPNINVAPVFFSYYVMNISYLSYLNKASMEGNGTAERGGVGRKWREI